MMSDHVEIEISPDARVQSSTRPSGNEWLDTMMTETKEDSQLKGPRMPRVPSTFIEIAKNKDCYCPSVVSIGPYHHGKAERFKEMQERKVLLAREFIKDSPMDASEMYCKMEQSLSNARDWYMKDGTTLRFDNEQFAQMMFLDGCFILQFLYCLYHHPENLKMASHKVNLVARDLFLLENQLPFEVLDALMRLRFEQIEEGMALFEAFYTHIRAVPPRSRSCRERISNTIKAAKSIALSSSQGLPGNSKHPRWLPSHLLEHFHNKFVGTTEVPDDRKHAALKGWYRDRSLMKTWSGRYFPAQELRNVGIHFKPSRTSLFIDVWYSSTWLAGILCVPPLSIDDSTKSLLLNLVAYEAYQGTASGCVTTYVCFMDSLIDHPEDVKSCDQKA